MREIKEFDQTELDEDLRKIAEKHGMVNCSFCGQTSEGEFYGLFIKPVTMVSVYDSVLNVGRLWQHCRETIRKELNKFDTWK